MRPAEHGAERPIRTQQYRLCRPTELPGTFSGRKLRCDCVQPAVFPRRQRGCLAGCRQGQGEGRAQLYAGGYLQRIRIPLPLGRKGRLCPQAGAPFGASCCHAFPRHRGQTPAAGCPRGTVRSVSHSCGRKTRCRSGTENRKTADSDESGRNGFRRDKNNLSPLKKASRGTGNTPVPLFIYSVKKLSILLINYLLWNYCERFVNIFEVWKKLFEVKAYDPHF